MTDRTSTWGALALAIAIGALTLSGCAPAAEGPVVSGTVAPIAEGVDAAGWTVTAWDVSADPAEELGTATTDADGAFEVAIGADDTGAPVYLDARPADGERALLAAVAAPDSADLTLNERTTVAAGYGLAQFFDDIAADAAADGPAPMAVAPSGEARWLVNAASMAANLADPATGDFGETLTTAPNGSETSTLPTFISLANALSGCLADEATCDALFDAATSDSFAPASAAAAFAGIARDPSAAVEAVYEASLGVDGAEPGLSDPPAAWTLALRFDGDGEDLAGPGNFAIDGDGNIWINNNYDYNADPSVPVCGSDEAFEFAPNGELLTTLQGGGLSGSGFGIAFADDGRLWFSNFGFAAAAPGCPQEQQPPHNSMSVFDGDAPVTPDTGYTQGDLSWPQGIVFDTDGTLWIANCGNDTVALYPDGDPEQARSLTTLGLQQPFGVADNGELVFVTGTVNSAVAVVQRDGTPTAGSPLSGAFDRPMGIAADAAGNVWVANSGGITLPCPQRVESGRGTPSVTMISPDGTTVSTPYTGGGVTLPWGLAVDGDGNVWVANFSDQRVSAFCGADASTCPRGLATGDAISPDDTGYAFDGLTRSTGIAVDPSGNVWVTNNWILVSEQTNPGGHQIVAYVGAAAPVVPGG